MSDQPKLPPIQIEAAKEDIDVACKLLENFRAAVMTRPDLGVAGASLIVDSTVALRLLAMIRLAVESASSSHGGCDEGKTVVH